MLDYKNYICPLLTQAKGDYVMCKGPLCACFYRALDMMKNILMQGDAA